MSKFLAAVFIVALVVAFFYILLNKWMVWEYLQVHADSWLEKIFPSFVRKHYPLNKLFSCSFCTTWWMSVAMCLALSIISGRWEALLIPFCSTPISRYLV